MANPEHLAILNMGVETWNQWRKEHPEIAIDLSDVDLFRKTLIGVDLHEANLERAILMQANLSNANFSSANLSKANLINTRLVKASLSLATLHKTIFKGANLNYADLTGVNSDGGNFAYSRLCHANFLGANLKNVSFERADLQFAKLINAQIERAYFSYTLLSGSRLDKITFSLFRNIKGAEIGVNGIYCRDLDSAALMQITPPGNSMQGSNTDAIIESLKHARKLHNASLSFAGIALLIAILKPKTIKLPLFPDFSSEPSHYAVLAILCSIGILMLTESFMRSALDGAQYINDRDSAMKVGHFPWTMSRYDKGKWGKWQSLIMRIFNCLHPLAYPVLYFTILPDKYTIILPNIKILPDIFILLFPPHETWFFYFGNILVGIAYLSLLFLCGKIFWLSQQFQKPILFDPKTEINRKTDTAILNEKVSELIELLKQK